MAQRPTTTIGRERPVNPYIPALEAELRRAGVRTWHYELARHNKLRFWWRGQRQTLVFPQSPSDARGAKNAVAQLRRMLGLSAPKRGNGTGKRRRAPAVDRPPELSGVAPADPWAALRAWAAEPAP